MLAMQILLPGQAGGVTSGTHYIIVMDDDRGTFETQSARAELAVNMVPRMLFEDAFAGAVRPFQAGRDRLSIVYHAFHEGRRARPAACRWPAGPPSDRIDDLFDATSGRIALAPATWQELEGALRETLFRDGKPNECRGQGWFFPGSAGALLALDHVGGRLMRENPDLLFTETVLITVTDRRYVADERIPDDILLRGGPAGPAARNVLDRVAVDFRVTPSAQGQFYLLPDRLVSVDTPAAQLGDPSAALIVGISTVTPAADIPLPALVNRQEALIKYVTTDSGAQHIDLNGESRIRLRLAPPPFIPVDISYELRRTAKAAAEIPRDVNFRECVKDCRWYFPDVDMPLLDGLMFDGTVEDAQKGTLQVTAGFRFRPRDRYHAIYVRSQPVIMPVQFQELQITTKLPPSQDPQQFDGSALKRWMAVALLLLLAVGGLFLYRRSGKFGGNVKQQAAMRWQVLETLPSAISFKLGDCDERELGRLRFKGRWRQDVTLVVEDIEALLPDIRFVPGKPPFRLDRAIPVARRPFRGGHHDARLVFDPSAIQDVSSGDALFHDTCTVTVMARIARRDGGEDLVPVSYPVEIKIERATATVPECDILDDKEAKFSGDPAIEFPEHVVEHTPFVIRFNPCGPVFSQIFADRVRIALRNIAGREIPNAVIVDGGGGSDVADVNIPAQLPGKDPIDINARLNWKAIGNPDDPMAHYVLHVSLSHGGNDHPRPYEQPITVHRNNASAFLEIRAAAESMVSVQLGSLHAGPFGHAQLHELNELSFSATDLPSVKDEGFVADLFYRGAGNGNWEVSLSASAERAGTSSAPTGPLPILNIDSAVALNPSNLRERIAVRMWLHKDELGLLARADTCSFRLKVTVTANDGSCSPVSTSFVRTINVGLPPDDSWTCIDFGTSAIGVALVQGEGPRMVALQNQKIAHLGDKTLGEYDRHNPEGSNQDLIPSYIGLDPPHDRNNRAQRLRANNQRYDVQVPFMPYTDIQVKWREIVYAPKSWLGLGTDTITMKQDIPQIVNGALTAQAEVKLGDLLSDILERLAGLYLTEVKGGYLTLTAPNTFAPPHLDALRKAATRLCTKLEINIKDVTIVSESDAAAYYFLTTERVEDNSQKKELVLVYDLGAGTLDLSLIEVTFEAGKTAPSGWTVVHRLGVALGGNKMDEIIARIVDYHVREACKSHPEYEYTRPIVDPSPAQAGAPGDDPGSIPSDQTEMVMPDADHRRTAVLRVADEIRNAKVDLFNRLQKVISPGENFGWSNNGVLKAQRLDIPFTLRLGQKGYGNAIVTPRSGQGSSPPPPPPAAMASLVDVERNNVTDNVTDIVLELRRTAFSVKYMRDFLTFMTSGVLDELFTAAQEKGYGTDKLSKVIISGRAALWPQIHDYLRTWLDNVGKSNLLKPPAEPLRMKEAVAIGAVDWTAAKLKAAPPLCRMKTVMIVRTGATRKMISNWAGKSHKLSSLMSVEFMRTAATKPDLKDLTHPWRKYLYVDMAGGKFSQKHFRVDESDSVLLDIAQVQDGEEVITISGASGTFRRLEPMSKAVGAGASIPWPIENPFLPYVREIDDNDLAS